MRAETKHAVTNQQIEFLNCGQSFVAWCVVEGEIGEPNVDQVVMVMDTAQFKQRYWSAIKVIL